MAQRSDGSDSLHSNCRPLVLLAAVHLRLLLFQDYYHDTEPHEGGPLIRSDQQSVFLDEGEQLQASDEEHDKALLLVAASIVFCWTSNEMFIFVYFLGYSADFGTYYQF
ncbi:hypothetical protein LSH36_890g00027 [Paralvinella palmiformis]|uniref:Uncharacterized protein n=1 Tax=Paralvinella palmiformis TaxID=53620 RepID=A0AAD9IYQ4_9ANNE|nr:hypothetical protein LSH36_890g00027 [Paralvinella palmiformis]